MEVLDQSSRVVARACYSTRLSFNIDLQMPVDIALEAVIEAV